MRMVNTRKKMMPTPRRLIPMYCSGWKRSGTSGRTKPSTQPRRDQSSQIVSATGRITTMPVRKDERSRARTPGRWVEEEVSDRGSFMARRKKGVRLRNVGTNLLARNGPASIQ